MTKPANTEAIEKQTNTPWHEWVAYLDEAGGRELSHREIADLADAKANDDWWAQSIAVAYEQHIGRRAPGQRSDGTFDAAVSKTLDGSPAEVMARWIEAFGLATEFDGVEITKVPTTSQTDKNHHWACGLADGTRVNADANTYGKPSGKTGLTITHAKLASANDAERWKTFWKSQLADF